VRGVAKVGITFLYQWRVGVRRFEEAGRQRWCKFSVLVSAREGRQRNDALPEDEVKR
jgi:hypothetical protein